MVGTGALIGHMFLRDQSRFSQVGFDSFFDPLPSTEIQTHPILKLLIGFIFVDICFPVFTYVSLSLS